jgi:hypothetical protein
MVAVWLTLFAAIGALIELAQLNADPRFYVPAIVVPTSIAASLVLTRVNTALGMRVSYRSHFLTAIMFVAAWATAIICIFIYLTTPQLQSSQPEGTTPSTQQPR